MTTVDRHELELTDDRLSWPRRSRERCLGVTANMSVIMTMKSGYK
jgi:hypothetical protein